MNAVGIAENMLKACFPSSPCSDRSPAMLAASRPSRIRWRISQIFFPKATVQNIHQCQNGTLQRSFDSYIYF
jgi:hypothetical protein